MFLGGSNQRGSGLSEGVKTTDVLLSELNKKIRDLNTTMCCKLQQVVDGVTVGSKLYNANRQFVTTPGVAFSLQTVALTAGLELNSVSFSVLGTTGQTASIAIGGASVPLPVGFSASYDGSTGLVNDFVVSSGSTATVVFSAMIGTI